MFWKYFFLTMVVMAFVFAALANASGIYRIGKDEGGLYMETDQDGSWYIDPSHVRDFSPGEKGTYVINDNRNGTFIVTHRGKKYPINMAAREEWERERQAFNERQRRAEGIETPVTLLNGNHVLVPVTIVNAGNEMRVQMLLDTGASTMVLHRDVADRLMLKNISSAKLMTADGSVIDSDIVKLDSVDVGPIHKQGLLASVIEHSGARVPYQGLLGMNFLKDLDYRIDFTRQMIQWKP